MGVPFEALDSFLLERLVTRTANVVQNLPSIVGVRIIHRLFTLEDLDRRRGSEFCDGERLSRMEGSCRLSRTIDRVSDDICLARRCGVVRTGRGVRALPSLRVGSHHDEIVIPGLSCQFSASAKQVCFDGLTRCISIAVEVHAKCVGVNAYIRIAPAKASRLVASCTTDKSQKSDYKAR